MRFKIWAQIWSGLEHPVLCSDTEGGKDRMHSPAHSIPRHQLTEPMLSWGPRSFQRASDLGPAPWNYYWRQQESCPHHAVYYPIPAIPIFWSYVGKNIREGTSRPVHTQESLEDRALQQIAKLSRLQAQQ